MKMIKPVERVPLIHSRISKTPVNIDSIEALTPETDRSVTGVFVNVECPGQPAKVCGRYYRGMQYFSKVFLDGEKATIPLSVARFINERCCHEQHLYSKDEQGNPIKGNKKIYRYKFHSESF